MNAWQMINSIPGIGPYLPWVGVAVAICSALATALPPGKSGSAYGTFRNLVRWVGLNFGHAPKSNTPAGS